MQDLTFHLAMSGIFSVLVAGLVVSWRLLKSYPDPADFSQSAAPNSGRMAHALSAIEEKRRKRIQAARLHRTRSKKRAA